MRDNRDLSVIKHILDYCARIEDTLEFFGNDNDDIPGLKAYCADILEREK